jgi:hypothetical protein
MRISLLACRDFYPSAAFPILVYFKETQTKPEGQVCGRGHSLHAYICR